VAVISRILVLFFEAEPYFLDVGFLCTVGGKSEPFCHAGQIARNGAMLCLKVGFIRISQSGTTQFISS
jgi:hypothetical protein